jgi:hypothetical protein
MHSSTDNITKKLIISSSALLLAALGFAQVDLIVPPEPAVKPVLANLSEIDTNSNLIDDIIDQEISAAQATLANPAATPQQRAEAQAVLDEVITATFDFRRQITLEELIAFVQSGGQVTWIFKASYGWIGRIARGAIPSTVALMRQGFNGVEADRVGHAFIPADPQIITVAALSGNRLTLSWPATGTNFVLESSHSMVQADWAEVPQTPLVNGNKLTVTNEILATQQFYRLRRR